MITKSIDNIVAVNVNNKQNNNTAIMGKSAKNTSPAIDKSKQNNSAKSANAALDSAIKKFNDALMKSNIKSQFVMDKRLGRTIVQFVNQDTKEIVKQIPSEEAIRLSESMEELIGLMTDKRT